MSWSCPEKAGANSVPLVTPSAITSARYSPDALSLKFVCNGAPAARRSLFEAKTTMKRLGPRLVAGNSQWVRFVALSARYHPPRLTVLVLELYSSIQSEYAPSSSARVVLLLAMNSEITTLGAAVATLQARSIANPRIQ